MEILGIELQKKHLMGILTGILAILINFIAFFGNILFYPNFVIAILIAAMPIIMDYLAENKKQSIYEIAFLDFVRNLVTAVKSGMPMSAAIIDVSKNDYGPLMPFVEKLSNQVEWSIPVHKALLNFGEETKNHVIQRAISTVIEAEMAGGSIEDVLDSITESLISIKEIKMKRDSAIHSQIIQSYVIFFIFLGVMIVIQNLLIPYISQISGGSNGLTGGDFNVEGTGSTITDLNAIVKIDFSSPQTFVITLSKWFVSFRVLFMMLALFQAAFSGLVMGKLATGSAKSGIKHSLILTVFAFIVITLSQGLL